MERQQIESKNTITFLKYVLGRRAPKHDSKVLNSTFMNQNSGDVSIMSKSLFNYTNSKMSLQ